MHGLGRRENNPESTAPSPHNSGREESPQQRQSTLRRVGNVFVIEFYVKRKST